MKRQFGPSAALLGGAFAVVILAGKAPAQSEPAIERSVRTASVVVMAEPESFKRPTPRAIFRVAETLKGESDAKKLEVSLEKAPIGMWPGRGESRILCLAGPARGGIYELASHFGSVLGTDKAEAVKKALERKAVAAGGTDSGTGGGGVSAPVDPAIRALARRVKDSDTVLVGVLSNLSPKGAGSTGTFKVDEALHGYGGYSQPVTVRFPGPPPEAGEYGLFLKGSLNDDGFTVASSKGVVRLADPEAKAKLKGSVEAAGASRKDALTTVQAALTEWQAAWNKRDLERCIRCYSTDSDLRKNYDLGEEGRKRLSEQMQGFPGAVELSIQRMTLASPAREGAKGTADVKVLLMLSGEGFTDRRTATMKFVHEKGEWLILREGF